MVALDPRAAARRRPGAPRLAALEPRRGRRVRDRAEGGRRRPPAGRRLLERGHARRDRRVHPARVRRSPARARRCRRGRVGPSGSCSSTSRRARRRSRSSPSCAAARARAPATPARSTRSRPACCVLLSGAATRLAPCFVGLDKRYVTDVDLTATTTTGDPEGEVVERHEPPSPAELEDAARGPPRRGRAADPGRLGGEDRRRARLPARAARRRGRDAAAPLAGLRARASSRVAAASVRLDAARQLRDVRALDRGGARRPLPDAAADGGRPVRGRGGRPGAAAPGVRGARAAPGRGARAACPDARSASARARARGGVAA